MIYFIVTNRKGVIMRVLLTGAGGFVGHHTLSHLLKTTDEVVETTTPVKMPKSVPPPKQFKTSRVRGQGPRQDGEWTHVSRNKKQEPSTNTRMKKHLSSN